MSYSPLVRIWLDYPNGARAFLSSVLCAWATADPGEEILLGEANLVIEIDGEPSTTPVDVLGVRRDGLGDLLEIDFKL